jgi:hypothetical protein
MAYATPIAFLLQEHYFCRDRHLNAGNEEYSLHLLHMIQLFYEQGTALEKYMVEHWQEGTYSADVMLVMDPCLRPGRPARLSLSVP